MWNTNVLWANWTLQLSHLSGDHNLGWAGLVWLGLISAGQDRWHLSPPKCQNPKITAGTLLSKLTYVTFLGRGWSCSITFCLASGGRAESMAGKFRPRRWIEAWGLHKWWVYSMNEGSLEWLHVQDMFINYIKLFCFLVAHWGWKHRLSDFTEQ